MNVIPSLSGKGWLTSLDDRVDKAFSLLFLSDFSQSTTYYTKVSSMQYIIAKNFSDPATMQSRLTQMTDDYFRSQFERASVTVSVKVVETELNITFSGTLSDGKETTDIQRALLIKDASTAAIINALMGENDG